MTQETERVARLTAALPAGEAIDLSGQTFTEPVVLDGQRIASVDLTGARFRSRVSFRNAVFSGLSWFKDCVFEDGVNVSGASFGNDARFDNARFERDADFRKIDALGAADFSGCVFGERVAFDGATFSGCLSLAGATITKDASLRHVQCLGGLWLDRLVGAPRLDTKGLDVHGRLWLRNLAPATSGALVGRINAYGYSFTDAEPRAPRPNQAID